MPPPWGRLLAGSQCLNTKEEAPVVKLQRQQVPFAYPAEEASLPKFQSYSCSSYEFYLLFFTFCRSCSVWAFPPLPELNRVWWMCGVMARDWSSLK